MIDPFIRQLILKYHARGNTELEIAIIAGVDISVVRQCLEEYQANFASESQVDSQMAYQGTYEIPVNTDSTDMPEQGTSTQKKISYYQALAAGELVFAHQVSLPHPNTSTAPVLTSPSKSERTSQAKHSNFRPQGKDLNSPYSLQSACQAYTDNYSSVPCEDESAPLKPKTQQKLKTNKRSRAKSLDKYQDLIMQLLIAHNYNCTKVYQELTAQGIETKLRTVQRYSKQLMSEKHQELKQNVMAPIDVAEHPENMVLCATLMSSNVVTIPAAIRKVLKLKAQDQVIFIYENGQVTLAKARKDHLN